MMEDTLSKTAQAKKLLLEFWSDFQPHSVHEFRDYLKKNNITIVDRTHISSAVYTATQQDILVRVDRGNYQAGINFHEDIEIPMKKMAGIQSVLLQTKRVLSIPINIVELTPKERELIPRYRSYIRNAKECWRNWRKMKTKMKFPKEEIVDCIRKQL